MYNSQITAERIKKRATAQSVSMTQLSESCGISKNAISQAGKSQEGMKAKNLYAIAEILECSLDYLLGRTDNPMISSGSCYVGDNKNGIVQTNNGSSVVNANLTEQKWADIIGQFLQASDKLKIEDKVEVMYFAIQKAKTTKEE